MNSKNVFKLSPEGYMIGITTKGEEFYFDVEDLEKINKHTWLVHNNGYVVTNINRKTAYLHKFVMGVSKGIQVDHKHGIKIDVRKSELRIATLKQNSKNKKIYKSSSSGFKGVSWNKKANKWQSQIFIDSKHISLGYYDTKEEAAKEYNKAASFYFGEFARLNQVS